MFCDRWERAGVSIFEKGPGAECAALFCNPLGPSSAVATLMFLRKESYSPARLCLPPSGPEPFRTSFDKGTRKAPSSPPNWPLVTTCANQRLGFVFTAAGLWRQSLADDLALCVFHDQSKLFFRDIPQQVWLLWINS